MSLPRLRGLPCPAPPGPHGPPGSAVPLSTVAGKAEASAPCPRASRCRRPHTGAPGVAPPLPGCVRGGGRWRPPPPPTSQPEVASEPSGSPGMAWSLVTVTLLSSLTPASWASGVSTSPLRGPLVKPARQKVGVRVCGKTAALQTRAAGVRRCSPRPAPRPRQAAYALYLQFLKDDS